MWSATHLLPIRRRRVRPALAYGARFGPASSAGVEGDRGTGPSRKPNSPRSDGRSDCRQRNWCRNRGNFSMCIRLAPGGCNERSVPVPHRVGGRDRRLRPVRRCGVGQRRFSDGGLPLRRRNTRWVFDDVYPDLAGQAWDLHDLHGSDCRRASAASPPAPPPRRECCGCRRTAGGYWRGDASQMSPGTLVWSPNTCGETAGRSAYQS